MSIFAMVCVLSCTGTRDGREADDAATAYVGQPRDVLVAVAGTVVGDASDPPIEFSDIAAVVQQPGGNIVVADRLADEVLVLSSDGTELFRFGQSGSGPREFRRPAYLAFRDSTELWVRDAGNARLVVYRLGSRGAEVLRTVPSFSGGAVLPLAVAFHPDGRVVDVRDRAARQGGFVYERHLLDQDGRSTAVQEIRPPGPDEVPVVTFSAGNRRSRQGGFFLSPYGPRHLVAHATNGDWAEAVSGTYRIRWFDPDGNARIVIADSLNPHGPPVTADERRVAAAADARAEQLGVDADFDVPEFRPVLSDLKFDAVGNLWVIRTRAPRGSNHADVFSPTGELLATVTWPGGIDVAQGFVSLERVGGIITGALGIESVGLVDLRPAPR